MSITVAVQHVEHVTLTSENEPHLLDGEWNRRYGERPFAEGDSVTLKSSARDRHANELGEDHVGKIGIVTSMAERQDVKVLFIDKNGNFTEIWTPEACLVAGHVTIDA